MRGRSPEADEAIRKAIMTDNDVSDFAELGAELLAETNRPNIITLAQFEPYKPMFNVDKSQYIPHRGKNAGRPNPYTNRINDLYRRWRTELGVNQFEVTYVVVSEEDRRVVYFLDRQFSRVHSDTVAGVSRRESIPANFARNPVTTSEGILLSASVEDLMAANQTGEQISHFQTLRMESAVIQRHFTEQNMAGSATIVEPTTPTDTPVAANSGSSESKVVFLDDDD